MTALEREREELRLALTEVPAHMGWLREMLQAKIDGTERPPAGEHLAVLCMTKPRMVGSRQARCRAVSSLHLAITHDAGDARRA